MVLLALGCGSGGGSVTSTSDDDEVAIGVLVGTGLGLLSTTGGAITTEQTAQGPPSTHLAERRAIEIALARGQGDWIGDLADELGLPDGMVGHLGGVLKAHREPLSRLLEDEELEVDDWERRLGQILCCDEWLYPFAYRRFRCRPAADGGARECAP
jgi:hypothetical protein